MHLEFITASMRSAWRKVGSSAQTSSTIMTSLHVNMGEDVQSGMKALAASTFDALEDTLPSYELDHVAVEVSTSDASDGD